VGFIDTIRKAFTVGDQTGLPPAIGAAEEQQGMTTSTRLGPGSAILPADGFSRVPRTQDYRSGYNVSARPRTNERVAFETLRGLVDAYDVAQMCITHRIDSVRALDWEIIPADGVDGDISESIKRAREVLRKPDGELFFKAWMSKYLWDILAYDAGTLYRIRNNAGRTMGLRVIDGTTIAPLLDGWGNRPTAPAPAWVQFVQGTAYNWLTDDDLIYVPFRPTSNSPYGKSPLETILLNANTDLRFQQHFLERFTAGNIPQGFGISPDDWSPEQIGSWQDAWDALLAGDTEAKSQIRWVPGGSKFEFPNQQDFSDAFSLFLMRKTAAAYHVTPADLGFTDNVNKSVGESQLSVQQRVGDLPLVQHLQDILTAFLQDDLGLPVEFKFDVGGEQEDRLQTAQSDKIYLDGGVIGVSELREMRFGKMEAEGEVVPRYIYSTKEGAVPLSVLFAASAPIDDETGAPQPASIAPAQQLSIEAVTPLVKAETDELATFRRFAKARLRTGVWRDFQFSTLDRVAAHRANTAGHAELRKAAGELVAAGLAVVARDTGRVLMLQRALDPTDPAAGTWEFPGGHIEPGEYALEAAQREWSEEVGAILPDGLVTGDWASPDGIYAGYVWTIDCEAEVPPRSGHGTLNPDDPDGDCVETIAWFDPIDLVGNPAVRPELAGDLRLVVRAFAGGTAASTPAGDSTETAPAPSGAPPAAQPAPIPEDDALPLSKGWRDTPHTTPQLDYDLTITDHFAPEIQTVLERMIEACKPDDVIAEFASPIAKAARAADNALDWLHQVQKANVEEVNPLFDVIRAKLAANASPADLEQLSRTLSQVYANGWMAGEHAAAVQVGAHTLDVAGQSAATLATDWGKWVPGDQAAAIASADGALAGLLATAIKVDGAVGIRIVSIHGNLIDEMGNRIANGVRDGKSVDSMGRTIRDLVHVGGTSRAYMIAHTESTRAVMAGTMKVYGANGVQEWDVIVSAGACTRCLAEEAANPHKTGDEAPPFHPFCRCSGAPRADSIDSSQISALGEPDGFDPSGLLGGAGKDAAVDDAPLEGGEAYIAAEIAAAVAADEEIDITNDDEEQE
jgi:8-oxo-dGTP pyrophosphatase MutT (NUDIX family)